MLTILHSAVIHCWLAPLSKAVSWAYRAGEKRPRCAQVVFTCSKAICSALRLDGLGNQPSGCEPSTFGGIIGGGYKCDGIIKKSVPCGSTRNLNIVQYYFSFLLLIHFDVSALIVFEPPRGTVDLIPQIFAYDTLEEEMLNKIQTPVPKLQKI